MADSQKATDPDDIHLYTSPWVNGTRAANYFGPVGSKVTYEKSSELGNAIVKACDEITATCSVMGGNAVVGVEITIDPFSDEPYVHIAGTSALLVSLFE